MTLSAYKPIRLKNTHARRHRVLKKIMFDWRKYKKKGFWRILVRVGQLSIFVLHKYWHLIYIVIVLCEITPVLTGWLWLQGWLRGASDHWGARRTDAPSPRTSLLRRYTLVSHIFLPVHIYHIYISRIILSHHIVNHIRAQPDSNTYQIWEPIAYL